MSLVAVTRVLDAQARRQETSDQGDPGVLVKELMLRLADRLAAPAAYSECLIDAGEAAELACNLGELSEQSERVLRSAPESADRIGSDYRES